MNDEIALELVDILRAIEARLGELVTGTMLDRVEAREEPIGQSDLRPPRDIYDPQQKL